MKSCLFIGHVRHTRYQPVEHRLDYPLYVFGIHLDELEALDKNLFLFGYNRLRPLAIHDRDYLDDTDGTIREKLLHLLKEKPFLNEIDKFVLITLPRYFHYVFNPVSFYYGYSTEGKLLCMVAEVNNTFGERHVYIPEESRNDQKAYPVRFTAAKSFHVSPFNDMTGTYEFLFGNILRGLDIRINLWRENQIAFTAELTGDIVPLDNRSLVKTLINHPLIPTLTMSRIYREAAKLYFLRKLPYHEKPVPVSMMTIRKAPPTYFQRRCRHFVLEVLQRIQGGRIRVILPEGKAIECGAADSEKSAEMVIHDHTFFSRVVLSGDIGLGETYTDNLWDCDDLALLFRVFFENRDRLADGNFLSDSFYRFRDLLAHRFRPNTRKGSQRNIQAHYDLGNDFYQLFLDSSMTYSCALYVSPSDSLEQAQEKKRQEIIRKAAIRPEDHVLEIGCGWGSFAIDAAKQTGCRVTGVTLSQAQYDYARERVRQEGLEKHIEIRLADYRLLTGAFDRIISIEMLEAVGHRHLETFFQTCENLLKTDGKMVIQAITVPGERYETYRCGIDWIRKHIFPGGHLLSLHIIRKIISEKTYLKIDETEEIGPHYVRTLREWRDRLNDHLQEVRELGFDRSFQRKWNYYLACCEGGFASGELGDVQMVLHKT